MSEEYKVVNENIDDTLAKIYGYELNSLIGDHQQKHNNLYFGKKSNLDWYGLVDIAEKLGYEFISETNDEDGELEFLCNDSRYHSYQFYDDGDVFLNNFVCSERTPDQMLCMMLALKD